MFSFRVCTFIAFASAAAARFEPKIINGYAVRIEDFPYVASLQIDGAHMCGAAIVARTVLVTAAHCLQRTMPIAMYAVRVGSTRYDVGGVLVADFKHVQRHPAYDATTADYDVAVLVLADGAALNYTASVWPVGLPRVGDAPPSTGDGATVVGWGSMDARDDRNTSLTLRSAAQRTISAEDCRRYYPGVNDVTMRMLCAQNFAAQQDACAGDSGGPLVARGELIGIVSWGMGCNDARYPGVYTDVSAVVDFIRQFVR